MGKKVILDIDNGSMSEIKEGKFRNWTAVLYPENMIPNWQDRIYRLLECPFEYIIHDKDEIEIEEDEKQPRKTHIHIILHYGNCTTYNSAFSLFDRLSKLGFHCLNKIEPVRNLLFLHRYLTHSTPDAISQGKHRYNEFDIENGNNWDLGAFVELEEQDRLRLYRAVRNYLCVNKIRTVLDLEFAIENGAFDSILDDFSRDMLVQYINNNRTKFVQICKEINFKMKKNDEKSIDPDKT